MQIQASIGGKANAQDLKIHCQPFLPVDGHRLTHTLNHCPYWVYITLAQILHVAQCDQVFDATCTKPYTARRSPNHLTKALPLHKHLILGPKLSGILLNVMHSYLSQKC
jgi:hypothetical protein